MRGIPVDPDSDVVGTHYAVVYAPRRQRGRFPDNCVEVMESAETAVAHAEPENNRYAARVVGPSRSSEGVQLYYLESWIDDGIDTGAKTEVEQ